MAIVVLLAFGWRVAGLATHPLGQAEQETVRLATRPLIDFFAALLWQEENGSLYHIFLRPWIHFFGPDAFPLRYASVVAATLSVALLWQVARRMVPAVGSTLLRNLPLLSTTLFVVNPVQLWYGQSGEVFAVAAALALLSSWSWLQAMWYSGFWRWAAYLLVTSLSIYTHLFTVLLVPVHLLWFLLANPLNRQRWKGYGLTLLSFLLPTLPLTTWGYRFLSRVVPGQGPADGSPLQGLLAAVPEISLTDAASAMLLAHAQGTTAPQSHYWLIPVFFLGLAGLLIGYTEFGGRIANVGMLAAWLIAPVVLLFAISLIAPYIGERPPRSGEAAVYVESFLWVGPAFTMFMALGAQVTRRAYGRVGSWISVGLVLIVMAFWGYSRWQQSQRPTAIQPGHHFGRQIVLDHWNAVSDSGLGANRSTYERTAT